MSLIGHGAFNSNKIYLLQNAAAILLQNATEVYYKMGQIFYYKMRQLLQNGTFITDCGSRVKYYHHSFLGFLVD